jgi:hypothetical protein
VESRRISPTAEPKHQVSVYYPFALVELVDIAKTDEYAETGEMMLSFYDADGCRVTLRVTPDTLEALCAKLNAVLKK